MFPRFLRHSRTFAGCRWKGANRGDNVTPGVLEAVGVEHGHNVEVDLVEIARHLDVVLFIARDYLQSMKGNEGRRTLSTK